LLEPWTYTEAIHIRTDERVKIPYVRMHFADVTYRILGVKS